MSELVRTRLLSDKNIFLSIYLVKSYIQNKELLTSEDRKKMYVLQDVFNVSKVQSMIKDIKIRLNNILDDDSDFFNIKVYFKPKKYDMNKKKVIFRPLHTASLVDQITMAAMLQVLVYEIDNDGKIKPSELSRIIPSNFYGNRISYNGKELFKPWQNQYHEYTSKANELLYNYSDTLEYKYEVSLDLENFFPSINPKVIYNYILRKLPLKHNENDYKTICTILKKLLIFKLDDINKEEVKWYIMQNNSIGRGNTLNKCTFAKGIPQGLPHSYFFANIFMLIIKEIYEKYLPGEMLFYVDDSSIFTNGINGKLNGEIFKDVIEKINDSIQKEEKTFLTLTESNLDNKFILPAQYCYKNSDFGVKVHNLNDKSVFSTIEAAKKHSGEQYLRGLSRETSKVGFDIYTTFSDEEINMTKSRTKAILTAIENELQKIDPNNASKKVYRDKLVRYRKYFKYRNTILTYKNTGDVTEIKKKIICDLEFRNTDKKKFLKIFFDKYNEDILAATIGFVFKRCSDESIDNDDLIKSVKKLILVLYGKNQKHSYLAKVYEPYLNKAPEYFEVDKYNSIRKSVIKFYHFMCEQSQEKKYKTFNAIIQRTKSDDDWLYNKLGFKNVFEYGEYIRINTDELLRMMINGIFSYIFGYKIDDKFTISKQSRNPIEYSEIRILLALRNQDFHKSKFFEKYTDYIAEEYKVTADYSIFRVLDIFKTFVSKSIWIDNLILIHKYCCDTWKNGSKYLYFYTLHNQEHAVSLIRNSIQLLHAISYFQLKKIDYYILFASCYLHDISMVEMPETSKFYMDNSEQTNYIYTDFIKNFNPDDDNIAIKKNLYDCYQKIDAFFETNIRSSHAKNSAQAIRSYKELSFIDKPMREVIAKVSEAHGFAAEDVYYLKSDGQKALMNLKLIAILLRLSDLLDMSRYRISKVILNHNIENINATSRFHWISHLITDGYKLNTVYSLKPKDKMSTSSFLKNGDIIEKVILTVNVLMSQTTEVECTAKCKNIVSSKIDMSDGKTNLIISCGKNKQCQCEKCTFLCKWFTIKNGYLFEELSALKQYLNNLPDNFYSSDIEVNVKVITNSIIPNDTFDYLQDYVNHY